MSLQEAQSQFGKSEVLNILSANRYVNFGERFLSEMLFVLIVVLV
jgi:hypothetical protein